MGRTPYLSRWGSGSQTRLEDGARSDGSCGRAAPGGSFDVGALRRRASARRSRAGARPGGARPVARRTDDAPRYPPRDRAAPADASSSRPRGVPPCSRSFTTSPSRPRRAIASSRCPTGSIVAEGRPGEVVTVELLRDVYGVAADVVTSPATGRPTVSVGPPETAVAMISVRALVVGGAGRAAPLFRLLSERGVHVSAGVLHGTDTDEEVAERLDLDRVSVPPFSGIDDDTASAWRRPGRAFGRHRRLRRSRWPGQRAEPRARARGGPRWPAGRGPGRDAHRRARFHRGRAPRRSGPSSSTRAERVTTYEAAVAAVLAVSSDG